MYFGPENNNFSIGDAIALSDAGTVTIDTYAAVVHTLSTTQNFTLNFSNTGMFAYFIVTCDATPRTVTYGTGVHGAAATIALTASKKNVLTFIYDGTEHVLLSTQVLS